MRIAIALILTCLSPAALAQNNTAHAIEIPDVQEVDFEALDVNATVDRPSMALISDRQRGTFNPLIGLRAHFPPEMAVSVRAI